MFSRLLATLSSSLGPSQASRELRWMKASIDSGVTQLSLSQMVHRRLQHEPLQYILGTQPFGPLNLLVRPPVLIPRPETEHWATMLAESLSPTAQKPISLLDLGTGSGCIPLLLCHLWPPGSVKAHAVDISPHALTLAQDNAALCGIPSRLGGSKKPQNTFSVFSSDFLADDFPNAASRVNSPFDVITSNPPYIPWKEYIELPSSVLNFEDRKALLAGSSGLDFYHAIARLVSHKDLLTPSAIVALEVGHNQADTVQSIIRSAKITIAYPSILHFDSSWHLRRNDVIRGKAQVHQTSTPRFGFSPNHGLGWSAHRDHGSSGPYIKRTDRMRIKRNRPFGTLWGRLNRAPLGASIYDMLGRAALKV